MSNLTINDVAIIEGNAGTLLATFTVGLDAPAPAGGVTFDIATADGTATASLDYVAQSLTGQTIPAGFLTYTFAVPVNGDTIFEPNETFFVNVTNVVGATVTDGQGQVTIFNDDAGPPALTINDVAIVEGNAGTLLATFTVGLDAPAPAGGVTFDIATADGTATASLDYVAQSLTGQTIPAGFLTYTFAVPVNGDTIFEPNETFFVNVTNVVGATVTDGQGQVTIFNDDAGPPALTINDVAIIEGNAGTLLATFTVGLDAPAPAGGVTFDIATADGTATAGLDYVAQSLTGQTIPAGFLTYTFAVPVNGDTTFEPNETFFVNVTNVVGATVTDGQGQVTIFNDDAAPPALSISNVAIVEGNAGTQSAIFTVVLDAPAPAGGVTFDIATADGTATAGSDYVAQSLTGQTIPAGSSTYTFSVPVNGDTTFEPNETFFVNVTNVVGATVANGHGEGTIVNDDAAPPALSISNVAIVEGNAGTQSAIFTVVLDAPAPAGGVTFDIATADGTATAGSDYVAQSLTGQTIPAGSSTYAFSVPVNGDTTFEPNETFFVNVTNVVGATVANGHGEGTIVNDDAAPPALSISNVAIVEGNAGTQSAIFTVVLDAPAPAGGVTFDIATADGTATAGSDYVAQSLTGQTIPAGSSSYTFSVTVNGDTTFEPDETFFVNVTNVVDATVTDGQGQGTITNDDILPPPLSPVPTLGNDSLTGTDGPDTIAGFAGDDIIDGLGAGDLLFGNQDNDTVFGRAGNDTVWGGLGNDSIDGAQDNDFLLGNEGQDTIDGGDGANTIVGGQDSSDGADLILAGTGPDLIWGNGGADTITADGGANTMIGGFGKDSIVTGGAADIIFGNEDADTISAGDGANVIFGGFGDDSILAGTGNDTIWGNENNDTIAGGTGGDRYAFLTGSGNDQINGFSGGAEGDRLDLQGQTFTTGTSADGDVLLTLSGGGTIELNGVTPANFSPGFVV